MRLWAEVFTPAGSMQGIVTLISAKIERSLDTIGSIDLAVPTGDQNAAQLLQLFRRVKIYAADRLGTRLIGQGILREHKSSFQASGRNTVWRGDDILGELRNFSTLRGRVYDNLSMFNIANDLIDLVEGWSIKVDDGMGSTTRRFDGENVFSALLSIAQGKGAHLRYGPEPADKWISMGAFGVDSGVRVTNIRSHSVEAAYNRKLVLIDRLEVINDGYSIVNWIEPVIGNGDAIMTLRRSTRTSPYPIQTLTGPDGRTIYYLRDSGSAEAYGEIQEVATLNEPVPVEAESVSLINASNVLYDWAAARLQRISVAQDIYKLAVRKFDQKVRPGDKVRLNYKGQIYKGGLAYDILNVDALFWVLKIKETWDVNGASAAWEISNVDYKPQSAADILAASIKAQKRQTVGLRLTATPQNYPIEDTIDNANPVTLTITIQNDVVEIGRAVLTVTRSNVNGPQAFTMTVDGNNISGGPFLDQPSAGSSFSVDIENYLEGVQGDHDVVVSCASGSGTITVEARVTEVGTSVT